ncbi:CapA family protein [Paenibacillus sp. UNC451MF]|uniref:CapA family protein n=1 Tax=Paenibacillus sp. UNC451MF TaxID=1449063 RepID=UPI0007E8EC0C|nr:CapA family protein [Paenibacillus sp. UNC451MF]
MSTDITIAAVGDFLMKYRIIGTARVTGEKRYSFDEIFEPVASYLRDADLTIGNLETTFSGTEIGYTVSRRSAKTGWPLFNCPDSFAGTLKRLGFDVLTTANNHCMDCGINGLKRTLRILDSKGLAHTGTYRTHNESQQLLIKNVKGIKIGVLSYTKTTNRIPVPSDQAWAVNLIRPGKIIADLKRLKAKGVDLAIVCMHFGREYSKYPNEEQKKYYRLLFKHGADIILGAHSHVIQPALFYESRDIHGVKRKRYATYSLGNFISTRLYRNDHTLTGLINKIHIRKNDDGTVQILNAEFIPTWVRSIKVGGRSAFRILPLVKTIEKYGTRPGTESERMSNMYQHLRRHIPKYHHNASDFKIL